MAKRVLALGFCLLAAGASPAAAHVPRAGDARVEPGMFGQRPLSVPTQRQASGAAPAATPRARCGEGSNPEPAIQGRVPKEEVDAGRADKGYSCNLTALGQSGSSGGFKVLRYADRNGRECAYYDTTLLFPTNATTLSAEPTGVAVLDMTDPRKPMRTASLATPAMQTPHESLNISTQRGILVAVQGNPAFAPGHVDVYDISQDCRFPQLMASAPVGVFGHESGMAPDGKTFYATSIGTGQTTAVDLTNPRAPVPLWVGQYDSHGMTVSDDGNRGYMAAASGLIIVDLSEIQARKPDPQVREISRLTWPNMTIPQVAHPVTIDGRPYLVEVDEYSTNENGDVTGHGPRVGAARIIDISDETKPRVVSNIRLEVHQPENREAIAGDYGARSPVQGYAAHYCNVPRRRDPGIVACSMITSGLRVFDIRDPERPREIGYFVAPPSTVSASGSDYIDERANYAMSQPEFVPGRSEIWYSDGTSGFYALEMAGQAARTLRSVRRRAACRAARLTMVSARGGRAAVRLWFTRRGKAPVRIDVRRGKRRVARFTSRGRAVTWRPRRVGRYEVRFSLIEGGRAVETRRLAVRVTRGGRVNARRSAGCRG